MKVGGNFRRKKIERRWKFYKTLDWITWKATKKKRNKVKHMDMASTSCNNCSLKEKEQVYTAARDGNLLYLKVRPCWQKFRRRTKTSILPKIPDFCRTLNKLFFLSFFVYFDSIFWLFFFSFGKRLKFDKNFIHFHRICLLIDNKKKKRSVSGSDACYLTFKNSKIFAKNFCKTQII